MSTPGVPYDSAPYSTERTATRAVVPEQEEQPSAPAAFPARTLLILAVVCLGQLMVLIDASIINVALPTIKTALNFSESDLQWVITAYALMFAGFLLLGGRAADLLGRRVVFLAGFALFTAASVVAGLAVKIGLKVDAESEKAGIKVIQPRLP